MGGMLLNVLLLDPFLPLSHLSQGLLRVFSFKHQLSKTMIICLVPDDIVRDNLQEEKS
jgi:hypothetical protein